MKVQRAGGQVRWVGGYSLFHTRGWELDFGKLKRRGHTKQIWVPLKARPYLKECGTMKIPWLPELLRQLADDSCLRVKLSVAGNPNTPPDVLEKYIFDDNQQLQYIAWKNPGMPIDLLLNPPVSLPLRHYHLLAHPETPLDIRRQTYEWIGDELHQDIIINTDPHPTVQEWLIEDEFAEVRSTAAMYLELTEQQLQRLLADPDPEVREGLACNDYVSDEGILQLMQDPDPRVNTQAESALKYRVKRDNSAFLGFSR